MAVFTDGWNGPMRHIDKITVEENKAEESEISYAHDALLAAERIMIRVSQAGIVSTVAFIISMAPSAVVSDCEANLAASKLIADAFSVIGLFAISLLIAAIRPTTDFAAAVFFSIHYPIMRLLKRRPWKLAMFVSDRMFFHMLSVPGSIAVIGAVLYLVVPYFSRGMQPLNLMEYRAKNVAACAEWRGEILPPYVKTPYK